MNLDVDAGFLRERLGQEVDRLFVLGRVEVQRDRGRGRDHEPAEQPQSGERGDARPPGAMAARPRTNSTKWHSVHSFELVERLETVRNVCRFQALGPRPARAAAKWGFAIALTRQEQTPQPRDRTKLTRTGRQKLAVWID